MAKRRVTVLDCDICGAQARPYRIGLPDEGMANLDLCDEHGEVLVKLASNARTERRGRRVFSMEDVARAEAAAG